MSRNRAPQTSCAKHRLQNEFQMQLRPQHVFLVEHPHTGRIPAKCRYSLCPQPNKNLTLDGDDYQITVSPGLGHAMRGHLAAYYHVACFEQLVDWTRANNLNRLMPLTPKTLDHRSETSATPFRYMIDTGAEHLVWRWRELMWQWMRDRSERRVPPLRNATRYKRDNPTWWPDLSPEELHPEHQRDYERFGAFLTADIDEAVLWSL